MSTSLRDQLLGLGYAPAPKSEPERRPKPEAARAPARPASRAPERKRNPIPARANRAQRSQEEIDLGKAYALRAQKEKDERIEAERVKQAEAATRRAAKSQLAVLLKDKALNDPAADIARHFDYGGKIKRIHVTAAQLRLLNAGELGVAQLDGRYLLIPAALLCEAEAIFPPAVALKIDPEAAPRDDPYSDPAYRVPDDLIW
ncbi:MAG: DUF2058 family protein [Arenimonas sp.]